jgi:hypothetical protein
MRRRYVITGLALVAALAIVSPVLAGSSLKKLVRKEVAKQLGGKTGPQGPPGASAASLWAVVTPGVSPSIARGSGAVSVNRWTGNPANPGIYEVGFNRAVNTCSTSVTSTDTAGFAAISRTSADPPSTTGVDANEVYVETKEFNGNPAAPGFALKDVTFNVQVFC